MNSYTKVIITGVTSFIGLSLVRELLKRDADITAVSRINSSRGNLLDRNRKKIIESTLSNLRDEQMAERCGPADIFYHIAWSSDFPNPRYNLEGQMRNVQYLKDAITLAHRCGCHTFVGIGSQAECGVLNEPITENTPNNPITAYAKAKCRAYEEVMELAEKYGMKFCWPRLLSAYGPYDRPHTLVSSCINAGMKKETIELTACEQIWDYIYVDDVARALIGIAERGKHGVKYPISSGKGLPLRDYIEIISRETNNPTLLNRIGAKPYVEGQPMYLVGDVKKLTADTGFEPRVAFEEGIQNILRMQSQ